METKEKYISRVDNLMFISYDGNNRFILPKLLLRCLKTWMFCFVEDDKVIAGIVKEIQLRNRTDRKKQISNPFPVVRVRFVHRVVSLVRNCP